ncbi:MAG: TIGR00730 family Rossman fold protein, partial [Litorivicinus sp.]
MHERKARMADLSDAFVALPGGVGTLEELFEIWTWTQLGLHRKPLGVLNVDGFYQGLIDFIGHVSDQGFVKPAHRDLLLSNERPGALLDALAAAPLPDLPKWVQPPAR